LPSPSTKSIMKPFCSDPGAAKSKPIKIKPLWTYKHISP
jgi:hypothetical protein